MLVSGGITVLHREAQVGPVEPGYHAQGRAEAQLLANILLHLNRGRRRQCEARGITEFGAQVAETQIVRPEVMAPARDTMGLVHHKAGDRCRPEHPHEPAVLDALRSQVQEPQPAQLQILEDAIPLLPREARVERGGGNAPGAQCIHLILHERDEGGDDDGEAGHQRSRHLEAEGLALARRHHDQGIPSRQCGFDHLALADAELLEAEPLPKVIIQPLQGRRLGRIEGTRHAGPQYSNKNPRRKRLSRSRRGFLHFTPHPSLSP